MSDVLDLAEKLWHGEASVDSNHPLLTGRGDLIGVRDGVAFWHGFSNSTVVDFGDQMLAVDSGDPIFGPMLRERVRDWRPQTPLSTVVYSHGHIDHVFGVAPFDAEADDRGWPRPTVIATTALPKRFDRYILTAGYNGTINRRQFGIDDLEWPTEYRYPDATYDGVRTVEFDDERVELHAARGETDDHTWTWMPDRKVLCCGDLFIWASPNAGNPQKVQRYAAEWAAALREMSVLGAEFLLPGHGVPVVGADRVKQALTETAAYLQSLHDQTIEMMNAGARLDEILHTVRPPAELVDRPFLQPVYDEPEFVVRNVWRLFGGWWDGNPATLKPAPEAAVAREVVALAGSDAVAKRAEELLAIGDEPSLRLAGHLAEWLVQADPSERSRAVKHLVFTARVALERSTMAKGVFGWAARESV